jgi:hypothetical protein
MQVDGMLTPALIVTRMFARDRKPVESVLPVNRFSVDSSEFHRREMIMLRHELLAEQGILILQPDEALRAEDFSAVAKMVDPYILQHGDLKGLLIDAPSFPGWDNFAALVSHLRFVRDHHQKVRRIAVVSDSKFLSVAPKIASQFVHAQLRTFDAAERSAALAWLETG